MDNGQQTTDKLGSVQASDSGGVGRHLAPSPFPALIACLSVVGCLSSTPRVFAAPDPCAQTFDKIAAALEQGQAGIALGYFTGSDRGFQTIRDAAALPEAARRLAAVFRTAKLKTTFDSKAIYTANWEASLGHSYAIDIGVNVGILGCTVQAW